VIESLGQSPAEKKQTRPGGGTFRFDVPSLAPTLARTEQKASWIEGQRQASERAFAISLK
jgi:hypothetical protein